MQGPRRPMLTFLARGWPAKVAEDGPKGQRCKDARVPLASLPILTMRADCTYSSVGHVDMSSYRQLWEDK
eukprot:982481-Pyramimonas_sp.AAC.1